MAKKYPLVFGLTSGGAPSRFDELQPGDQLFADSIAEYSGRNHIINGGMDVWQRALSATTTGYQAVDRFVHNVGGNAQATMSRVAVLPDDFPAGVFSPNYACRVLINANGTDPAANFITIQPRIENVARFSSRTLTISMWIRVNTAGLKVVFEATADPGVGGSPNGGMSNSIGVTTWTIAQANVWTYVTATFTFPSVRGFTIPTPEGSSLRFNLWMSAGTNHNSRNNNLGFQAVGSQFDFAMLQLEYGDVATPFEVLPAAIILALCQRYYEKSYEPAVAPGSSSTLGRISRSQSAAAAGNNFQNYSFKVQKRIPPAVVIFNPSTGASGRVQQDTDPDVAGAILNIGTTGFEVSWNNTAGRWGGWIHYTADSEI